jgi:hypothetical protein
MEACDIKRSVATVFIEYSGAGRDFFHVKI